MNRDTDPISPIRLLVFVSSFGERERVMVEAWRELDRQCHLLLEIQVHEVFQKPDLAKQFAVLVTPTMVVQRAPGHELRFIGFNNTLEAVLRSWAMTRDAHEQRADSGRQSKTAQQMAQDATQMMQEALDMKRKTEQLKRKKSWW